MREREKSEYALGGFGTGEVLDPFVPPVISNDDHHISDEETVEGFNLKISDLFSKFEDLKETLEEKIDTAYPERVSDTHPVTHDDETVNPEKSHQENVENLEDNMRKHAVEVEVAEFQKLPEEEHKKILADAEFKIVDRLKRFS
ncbi:hypothetical protein L2E82_25405 [Cichorium intybus]|uniref:Uncharacterized protein n=1 Tax=Cichorium intybus TaxID=13427 RepID=A0ACB9E2Z2_CICIN|nr:hypothetical protein L2E82_25405 [Cichorium intybus]